MRHARQETLRTLEPLLERLRQIDAMRERRAGVFYVKSRAFLHFHEDPAGVFADVRTGNHWTRMSATTQADADELLRAVLGQLTTP